MRLTDFDIYKDLLRERCGLMIAPDQTYLLESRLGPIAKKWGYPSIDGLTLALKAVPEKALISDVVEAMANHETSFFRDFAPFHIFSQSVIPFLSMARSGKKKIRAWSAACASGQEAYSLAMSLKNEQQLSGWKLEILGTDISGEILEQAKLGHYSQVEIQHGLSVHLLLKYFTQDGGVQWKLKDDIRKMVEYKAFNLLDEMKPLGVFDVIFCRNVLAGFEKQTAANVIKRMGKQLAEDGFLFLGGAEVAMNLDLEGLSLVPGTHSIYAPAGSPYLKIAQPLATGKVSA